MIRDALALVLSAAAGAVVGLLAFSGQPSAKVDSSELNQPSGPLGEEACDAAQQRALAALGAELRSTQHRADELQAFKDAYEGTPPEPPPAYPSPDRVRAALEEIVASSDAAIASVGATDCSEYPCVARFALRPIGPDASLSTRHMEIVADLFAEHPDLQGLTVVPNYFADYDAGVVVVTVSLHGSVITAEEWAYTSLTEPRRAITLDHLERMRPSGARD